MTLELRQDIFEPLHILRLFLKNLYLTRSEILKTRIRIEILSRLRVPYIWQWFCMTQNTLILYEWGKHCNVSAKTLQLVLNSIASCMWSFLTQVLCEHPGLLADTMFVNYKLVIVSMLHLGRNIIICTDSMIRLNFGFLKPWIWRYASPHLLRSGLSLHYLFIVERNNHVPKMLKRQCDPGFCHYPGAWSLSGQLAVRLIFIGVLSAITWTTQL